MLIPLIGIWWVFENIIDFFKEDKVGAVQTIIILIYQLCVWIGYKYLLEHLTDIGILPIQIHL